MKLGDYICRSVLSILFGLALLNPGLGSNLFSVAEKVMSGELSYDFDAGTDEHPKVTNLREIKESAFKNGKVDRKDAFFILNTREVKQGAYFEIRCYNAISGKKPVIQGNIGCLTPFIADADGSYVCIIPTNYYTEAGDYEISYGFEGESLNTVKLRVNARKFDIQYLKIDEEIEKETRSDEAYDEFSAYYPASVSENKYVAETNEVKSMNFIWPTNGIITTTYGETRYVNDSPTYYHHSGVDIAASLGEPVLATADGVVTLARSLILTGNTVVISHGNGLFSTYYHLNSIRVGDGDFVRRGEEIGTQGTTGFSTGTHLHFGISHYGEFIEPGYLILGREVEYERDDR